MSPKYSDVADAHASTVGTQARHRANATFVMLARNSDVDGAVQAVRELEDRFNRKHNYPWVFLNEQPFSNEFKRCAIPNLFLLSILTHHVSHI